MRIDAFATQPHYVAHMAGIWFGLGQARHSFYVAGLLADSSNGEGIPGWRIGHPPAAANLLTLVAGAQDEQNCPRPTIYLEHGAGQSYPDSPEAADHPAYSGTPGHDRTRLFLCPSAAVADRWRARYPHVPAVAVGCPRMDAWHRLRPPTPAIEAGRLTVAFTFHANNTICPETVTAWEHYREAMPRVVGEIRQQGWQVLGHGHPRLWTGRRGLRAWWEEIGVEPVDSFDEVIARADVLAVDNSSAGYEFASLDRPTVWMNAPWFRRTANHGMRFWDLIPGPQVDGPDELVATIEHAYGDPPGWREERDRVVRAVYVATDGMASERAVEAIMRLDATGDYSRGRGPLRIPRQPAVPAQPSRAEGSAAPAAQAGTAGSPSAPAGGH